MLHVQLEVARRSERLARQRELDPRIAEALAQAARDENKRAGARGGRARGFVRAKLVRAGDEREAGRHGGHVAFERILTLARVGEQRARAAHIAGDARGAHRALERLQLA